MRVPIEALNSKDPFDLPCIRFEGTVSTRMGYLPSSQMREFFALAAMPFTQALHSVAGDIMDNSRIRDDARGPGWITLPEFVFNADPTPQAFTLVQDDGGVVYINQGFFFTLTKLSRTIGWILDRLQLSTKGSLDEIAHLDVPTYITQEILGVFDMWQEIENFGEIDVTRTLSDVEPNDFARMEPMLHKVCQVIFFHESAHWMRNIYRPGIWSGLQSRTRNHLSRWMSAYDPLLLISRESHAAAVTILADPAVVRNWAEEIQCDLLAFAAAKAAHGGRQAAARDIYVVQGVLYAFVLGLQEIYDGLIARRELTHRTHPPASIRAAIVHYIDATEQGLPVAEYMFRSPAAACTYISACGTRILSAVQEATG